MSKFSGKFKIKRNGNYIDVSPTIPWSNIENKPATLGYLDSVTSDIQTQLDGKSPSSHTHNYAGSSSAGGVANSATKLATTRTLTTNLGSTTGASFNGTANASIGVTGTLPIANGGTGATTAAGVLTNLGVTATAAELNYVDGVTSNIQAQLNGKSPSSHTHNYAGSSSAGGAATSATKLATARTLTTNLGSSTSASFDGTANANIGVTGTLPIANGGTGATTAAGALSNLGITATATELNYVDGVTSNLQTQLNAKANGWKVQASTSAAAGWYRIAVSYVNVENCTGTFYIRCYSSGNHADVIINAGISYNKTPTLTQLGCIQYSSSSLTKVRIVYNSTTYSGNYAYIEVYSPNTSSKTIEVRGVGVIGWNSVAPSTAGSIPDGYTSKEITFVNGDYFVGNLSGNASSATKLATARTLTTNLASTTGASFNGTANASIGVTGTLPIANGGTGATTAAGVLTNLGVTATATELNYVDGVTSAIQTQLNAKQATITGAATTITSSNLTASRALVSNSSGKVTVSAVTSTELGYIDGVTSNVQTQLNAKAVKSTIVTATLKASSWSSKAQKITVSGLGASANGIIGLSQSATSAQREAARNAFLSVTAQAANSLTITCDNIVPTVDIPVYVIILG